jgi:alpha-L-fucosidase
MTISDKRKAYNKEYYEKHKKPKKFVKEKDEIKKIKRIRTEADRIHNNQYKVIKRAVEKYKVIIGAYQPDIVYFKKSDYRKLDIATNKLSDIGLGLFAKVDIEKETLIQYYIGEEISTTEFETIKRDNNERNYAIQLSAKVVFNCFKNYHCLASLANNVSNIIHKKDGTIPKLNSVIAINRKQTSVLKKVSIRSTKLIRKDQEIFVPYNNKKFLQ